MTHFGHSHASPAAAFKPPANMFPLKPGTSIWRRAVTSEDSAAGIRAVIARATPGDNGRFFSYDGEELPW